MDVKVYSTTWCGACKELKSYLTNRQIAFKDFVVDEDKEAFAEYRQFGVTSVPLTVITTPSGVKSFLGFSRAKLNEYLGV